jgi:tetratricopeptide (TPR) repeat protein
MHLRSSIASLTCLAFTSMILWPYTARAEAAAPAPAAAAAGNPEDAALAEAKQHFEAGRNAYNAGDYVTAIKEFKAAEAQRPSPILSYNIGLANEKLGKRRVAVKYYKRYLEQQPNAANKAEVDQRVRTLEADIAAQPPAAAAQPGGTAPQPEAEPAPSDMPPPDPGARPGAQPAQPGYDPYASQPPPGTPVAAKPAKKRSLWWIWLIVGGVVTITVVIVVVAVVLASEATDPYYYATRGGAADRTQLPESKGAGIGGATPLIRF